MNDRPIPIAFIEPTAIILSVDREDLPNRFARNGDDKFDGVAVEPGVVGMPLPLLRGVSPQQVAELVKRLAQAIHSSSAVASRTPA